MPDITPIHGAYRAGDTVKTRSRVQVDDDYFIERGEEVAVTGNERGGLVFVQTEDRPGFTYGLETSQVVPASTKEKHDA